MWRTCHHPRYDQLADVCERSGYRLELARPRRGTMELRVTADGARLSAPFYPAYPDEAARMLLARLDQR